MSYPSSDGVRLYCLYCLYYLYYLYYLYCLYCLSYKSQTCFPQIDRLA